MMAWKKHRYPEGLAGNDIHRLVRVTAYHVLVHEDRSLDGSTQQPRPVTMVTDLGLRSDPNLHWAQSGPFRVRIEARQPWVEPARLLDGLGTEANQPMLWGSQSGKKLVTVETGDHNGGAVGCGVRFFQKNQTKTHRLRNQAQLNCVSLRSRFDYEVARNAVKGQDERPCGPPLTAFHATTRESVQSRKKKQGGPPRRP